MSTMTSLLNCLVLFFCLILSLPAYAGDYDLSQEPSNSDLELVFQDQFSVVYRKPNVSFSKYKNLMLAQANVSLKKSWGLNYNRPQRRLGSRAMDDTADRIKREVMSITDYILQEELSTLHQFVLVSEASEDTLLLKPAIEGLEVYATELDKAYESQNYVERAGEGKLYLDIFDSTTGVMLFRLVDDKQARFYDRYGWRDTASTSVQRNQLNVLSKREDANVALREWIKETVKVLNTLD